MENKLKIKPYLKVPEKLRLLMVQRQSLLVSWGNQRGKSKKVISFAMPPSRISPENVEP